MRKKLAAAASTAGGWLLFLLFVWHFYLTLSGATPTDPWLVRTTGDGSENLVICVRWLLTNLENVLFFGVFFCFALWMLLAPKDQPPKQSAFRFSSYPVTTTIGVVCIFSAFASLLLAFALEVLRNSQPLSPFQQQLHDATQTIARMGVFGFILSTIALIWRGKRDEGKRSRPESGEADRDLE